LVLLVLVELLVLELLEVILYFHLSLLLAVDLVVQRHLREVTVVPAVVVAVLVLRLLLVQAHLVKGLMALPVMALQVTEAVLAVVLLLLVELRQAGVLATEGQVKPQA
jgi:hypothetical protein